MSMITACNFCKKFRKCHINRITYIMEEAKTETCPGLEPYPPMDWPTKRILQRYHKKINNSK